MEEEVCHCDIVHSVSNRRQRSQNGGRVLQLFVLSGTGRGPEESPGGDLGPNPSLRPRERTPTPHHLPIMWRKKCGKHTPQHVPGPGLHRDLAPAPALGPDPGPDESQEDAREECGPRGVRGRVGRTGVFFVLT